jgi:AcrR family transcriptional regulator
MTSGERKKRSAKSAEHILAVAARLFADRGYDASSMREIAEAAGVTKPTVYYYFQSKEGLFGALLNQGVDSLCADFDEIASRPPDVPSKRCLEDAVFAMFKIARKHADLNAFIHSLVFSPMKRPERRAIEEAFKRVSEEFRKVWARVASQGLIETSRIPSAALALRGAMMTCLVESLQRRVELSRKLAANIVDGCLYGYGTYGSSRRPKRK